MRNGVKHPASATVKFCTGCRLEKSVERFVKDERFEDGYRGRCKSCNRSGDPVNPVAGPVRESRGKENSTSAFGSRSPGARLSRRIKPKAVRSLCKHCGARLAWDNKDRYCGPHSTPEKRGEPESAASQKLSLRAKRVMYQQRVSA